MEAMDFCHFCTCLWFVCFLLICSQWVFCVNLKKIGCCTVSLNPSVIFWTHHQQCVPKKSWTCVRWGKTAWKLWLQWNVQNVPRTGRRNLEPKLGSDGAVVYRLRETTNILITAVQFGAVCQWVGVRGTVTGYRLIRPQEKVIRPWIENPKIAPAHWPLKK